MESKDIRDFKGRGPWDVASERSEDATKGPRPLKSRISFDSTSYLFRFVRLHTRIQIDAFSATNNYVGSLV